MTPFAINVLLRQGKKLLCWRLAYLQLPQLPFAIRLRQMKVFHECQTGNSAMFFVLLFKIFDVLKQVFHVDEKVDKNETTTILYRPKLLVWFCCTSCIFCFVKGTSLCVQRNLHDATTVTVLLASNTRVSFLSFQCKTGAAQLYLIPLVGFYGVEK